MLNKSWFKDVIEFNNQDKNIFPPKIKICLLKKNRNIIFFFQDGILKSCCKRGENISSTELNYGLAYTFKSKTVKYCYVCLNITHWRQFKQGLEMFSTGAR